MELVQVRERRARSGERSVVEPQVPDACLRADDRQLAPVLAAAGLQLAALDVSRCADQVDRGALERHRTAERVVADHAARQLPLYRALGQRLRELDREAPCPRVALRLELGDQRI